MSKSNLDEISDNTEQVNDILSKPPSWLIRWGSSSIFLVIFLLLFLSSIIKYPDIIDSDVTILTKNPPIVVVANAEGLLDQILVSDNDTVISGQILGIIDNTARSEDVLHLKRIISIIDFDSLEKLVIDENLSLGDIQANHNYFIKCFKELRLFQKLRREDIQAELTAKRLVENRVLLNKVSKQYQFLTEELKLAENDYRRNGDLFKQSAISEKELEKSNREYLAAKRDLEALDIEKTKINITIIELEQLLQDSNMSQIERDNNFTKAFYDSHKILQLAISEWEEKYLLTAAINGKVSFFNFRSVGQFIKHEEEIFSVVPTDESNIIGQVLLPIENSGKVEVGQDVNIKLDNYPYHEFGTIRGKIIHISSIPKNNRYAVEIKLTDGLRTTFQKDLIFRQEMTGRAEVITENISLLGRIFFQIRKIFM